MNLQELAGRVMELIMDRPFLEQRHHIQEDDGLIGLLHLATSVVKHNPPAKSAPEGQKFLLEVCCHSLSKDKKSVYWT